MSELTDQIEALVASEVAKQTGAYKRALQEAIAILQTLAGEPEMQCDRCGDMFVPTQKVVKTRHCFCSEECMEAAYNEAPEEDKQYIPLLPAVADKVASKQYAELHTDKRKHIAMPKEVKESSAGFVARSEAQQFRRILEKATKPHRDCPNCGKPTSKLFCSEECRKAYESPAKVVDAQDRIAPHPCPQCRKLTRDKYCSDECREIAEAGIARIKEEGIY